MIDVFSTPARIDSVATRRPLWRTLSTFAVFALAGPFVGLLLISLPTALAALIDGNREMALGGLELAFHPLGWMAALLLGGVPAAATGAVMLGLDRWRAMPERARYLAAAGVGALATFIYFMAVLYDRQVVMNKGGLVTMPLIGAVSALVCARLTRRWRYNPPLTPPANTATNEP